MRWFVIALLLSAGPAWAKPKASIVVESPVVGAAVEIDGKAVGKTPLKMQAVSSGTHTVRLRKIGFVEFRMTVRVTDGDPVKVFADLLPLAGVEGDLPLEPLAVHPKSTVDDLALEPLTEPSLVSPSPNAVRAPPTSPWYKQYWVWGAAAAAVAGGVVLGIVMSGDEADPHQAKPDRTWKLN